MSGLNLTVNSTEMSTESGLNTTFPPFVQCTPPTLDTNTSRIIKAVALCVILGLAIAGNIMIIIVVSKTKVLRRTVNLFILNMSAADVIMSCILIPQELIFVITGSGEWRVSGVAGLFLCKMVAILGDASNAVSILSMVCIAIDRFCAVALPMKRNLITGKLRTAAITLTWTLAAMYAAPMLYTARVVKTLRGTEFCTLEWEPLDHVQSMTVHVAMATVMFLITPWVLVAVLYSVMVIAIRRSRREAEQGARQRKRDLRVLKLALTIITAFAICNFPMCMMFLLIAFKYNWMMCHQPVYWSPLYTAAKYLVFASTCINPCICFVFSENFRKGLREVTRAQRSFIFSLVNSKRGHSTAMSRVDTGESHERFYELKDNGSSTPPS